MRSLIKTADYSFVNGTRTITVANNDAFTAADVRLIVNETQKKVYTSSMQKDNITVAGSEITFSDTFPVLATNDVLTIEIDFGIPEATSLTGMLNDIESILDTINGEVI